MPTYRVTAPDGRVVDLTGGSPPTDAELEEIFASLPGGETTTPDVIPESDGGQLDSFTRAGRGIGKVAVGAAKGIVGIGGYLGRAASAPAIVAGKTIARGGDVIGAVREELSALIQNNPGLGFLKMWAGDIADRANAAINAGSAGNTQEAVYQGIQGALSVVPGYGPLSKAGEKALGEGPAGPGTGLLYGGNPFTAAGDPEAAGELAGNLVLGAGPGKVAGAVGLGKPLSAITSGVSRAAGATAGRLLRPAEQIDPALAAAAPRTAAGLNRASAVGGDLRTLVYGTLEGSLFAKGPWRKYREGLQTSLRADIDDFVTRSAPGDVEGMVAKVPEKIQEITAKHKAEFAEGYGAIDDATRGTMETITETQMKPSRILAPGSTAAKPEFLEVPVQSQVTREVGGVRVATTKLKEFAKERLADLNTELTSPSEISRVKGVLDAVIAGPDEITFRGMQGTRTGWLDATRGADALVGRAEGIIQKLTSLSDEALVDAAQAAGKPEVTTAVRRLNGEYAEFRKTFNDSLVSKIVDTAITARKPEAIIGLLESGTTSADDLARLTKTLPPDMTQALRAKLFQNWTTRATKLTREGVVEGVAGGVDGRQLAQIIEDFTTNPSTRAFIPTELAGQMKALARVATKASPAGRNMLWSTAGLTGIASVGGLVDAGATIAGIRGLSYLVTTRPGINAMRNLLTAIEKNKAGARAIGPALTPEVMFWVRRVTQLRMQAEQAEREREGPPREGPGAELGQEF